MLEIVLIVVFALAFLGVCFGGFVMRLNAIATEAKREENFDFIKAMLKHIIDEDYEPMDGSYTQAASAIAQDALNSLEEIS